MTCPSATLLRRTRITPLVIENAAGPSCAKPIPSCSKSAGNCCWFFVKFPSELRSSSRVYCALVAGEIFWSGWFGLVRLSMSWVTFACQVT
jgi:hypothetical protein